MTNEQRKALIRRLDEGWPTCDVCNHIIPLGRLESLPETTRCIKHSDETGYIGFPVYSHKTAPEVAKIKPDPKADDGLGESARQLIRGYMRGR